MTTVFTWVITRGDDLILYVVIGCFVFLVSTESHRSAEGFYADLLDNEAQARAEALGLMRGDERSGYALHGSVYAYETQVKPGDVYVMSPTKAAKWLQRLAEDATVYGKALA